MALDVEEQQQVEQVKKWVAEYALTLIVAVVLAAIVLFGYQRWSAVHERALAHASHRYAQLLDDLAANRTQEANQAAEYLIKRYPRTTYAKLAELLLAQRDVSQQKFSDAVTKLQDVMLHANIATIRETARIRLARIQLQLNQPQATLDTLKDTDAPNYLPTVSAVRGDAYVALNNAEAAKQAYQQAAAGLPEQSILRSLVLMKLNNL
jgi:predicted negative regulator of RcsB-dependent stress response